MPGPLRVHHKMFSAPASNDLSLELIRLIITPRRTTFSGCPVVNGCVTSRCKKWSRGFELVDVMFRQQLIAYCMQLVTKLRVHRTGPRENDRNQILFLQNTVADHVAMFDKVSIPVLQTRLHGRWDKTVRQRKKESKKEAVLHASESSGLQEDEPRTEK